MKRLAFSESEDVIAALPAAEEAAARGEVFLFPTESFYGLGGDPKRTETMERIRQMKGRPQNFDFLVLCADWEQVESLVLIPEEYRVRLSRHWPAALTVVLRSRRDLPAAHGNNLAVRIPDHAELRALLYRVGPLTGTSANRHGEAPAVEVDAALKSLLSLPDLVLDGGSTAGGLPSTLVDLTSGNPRVLRPGSCPWEDPLMDF